MPDLGMFGSPIGEVNFSNKLNTDMNTLHTIAQTQAIPGQVAERAALTRLYGAEAAGAELKNEVQRTMQELMSRAYGGHPEALVGSDGQPRTQADMLDDLSQLSLQAGDVKQGADLASKASLVRMHDASAALTQVRSGVLALTAQKNEAEMFGRLLDNVTDQDSWERANNLYTFQSGRPSPYASIPWSPQLVDQLKAEALSRKDQLDLQIKDANAKSLRAFRSIRLKQHDRMADIAEYRAAIARDREERQAKTGGGRAVSSPQANEISQAARLVDKDFGKLESTDKMNAAFAIASEAKAMRRLNPGMDAETALQRAYKNARERGDFKEIAGQGLFKSPSQRYVGGGRTPETAVAVPADPKQLVKNRYYTNKDGVTGKWMGSGFEVISGGLPGGNANEDDEEDDEE